MFKDYFDIYVGLASGKEDVYKNKQLGNIEVVNGKDKIEKYIYIEKYPCDTEEINVYLSEHKTKLMERKIRKFNEKIGLNGSTKKYKNINANIGQDCIYIYNLTRKTDVAFLGKVAYFGGSLIMLKPKKICNLDAILLYINSDIFRDNFMFSGRFKIGQRQISNSYIPNKYLSL